MTAAELAADILALGPDHREALHEMRMIRKAMEGRRKYGPLDLAADDRDFMLEACAEGLDREWYMLIELAKRGRAVRDLRSLCGEQSAEIERLRVRLAVAERGK